MASFAYKSMALLYDNDSDSQSIRHQKLRIRSGTTNTYVPVTPLIVAREYVTNSKFESTNTNARHLNMAIDQLEVKTILPYGANNASTLKSCIRELLNDSAVFAGKYVGENILNGDTANHRI